MLIISSSPFEVLFSVFYKPHGQAGGEFKSNYHNRPDKSKRLYWMEEDELIEFFRALKPLFIEKADKLVTEVDDTDEGIIHKETKIVIQEVSKKLSSSLSISEKFEKLGDLAGMYIMYMIIKGNWADELTLLNEQFKQTPVPINEIGKALCGVCWKDASSKIICLELIRQLLIPLKHKIKHLE